MNTPKASTCVCVCCCRRLPSKAKQLYHYLHNERGFSDLALVVAFLTIPVAVGAGLICCLDAAYVRRARLEDLQEHEHRE